MKSVPATVLACLLAVTACGTSSAPEVDASKGQIRAELKEYAIPLTSATIAAGPITFVVRNVGGTPHSFVVIKSDTPDKLALDTAKQQAKEDGKVGALDLVDPGKSHDLRLELPAGTYVVICNVPTHYQLGMRATLTVQ